MLCRFSQTAMASITDYIFHNWSNANIRRCLNSPNYFDSVLFAFVYEPVNVLHSKILSVGDVRKENRVTGQKALAQIQWFKQKKV